MKLTLEGIRRNREQWAAAGISLPSYDPEETSRRAVQAPVWVHFGIGNIFRIFIAGIADDLMEKGLMDRGITCAETFDPDIVDRIYAPFDCLGLNVILNPDGTRNLRVCGAMAEAVKVSPEENASWERMKEVFRSPSLQMVSFTITEKGYELRTPGGDFLPFVKADIENGPDRGKGAMAVVAGMLWERFRAGGTPIALVSMDNCAKNGKLLKASVGTVAQGWLERGTVSREFIAWLEDESRVAFDCTMIDKITPRPSPETARDLEDLGVENMGPVITGKRTYIAPFANAEKPQYLVIEDRFPNGRPPLEQGFGVYLGDFETVCKCERMKVTACLNPAHTAVGPLGVVLGQERFADMLRDIPAAFRMVRRVIEDEGMPVVEDPGILSPRAFAEEVFERFTNIYLGDTNLRLATDASQGLGVRFGETIRAWKRREGSAEGLTAIPLGIAGFFRYMMGVDDEGNGYELAPDPLAEEIHGALSSVCLGEPDSLKDQLRPYLSNSALFGVDLYAAGLGSKIEEMLREMIAEKGAARNTLEKYNPA
ncbi:MAG: mannitol dehydrogenase family protein [Clostridia bacterium]|nr:mannitol dehydrogenase family protein [Clostridia bacterium]